MGNLLGAVSLSGDCQPTVAAFSLGVIDVNRSRAAQRSGIRLYLIEGNQRVALPDTSRIIGPRRKTRSVARSVLRAAQCIHHEALVAEKSMLDICAQIRTDIVPASPQTNLLRVWGGLFS
jgi:hypothetical protein